MHTLWQDVRYGLRMLAKTPGFTAIAVLTLALGIGANTGIFSVLRQVLLQRLPVPNPQQLVLVYSPGEKHGHVSSNENSSSGAESFSYPMYKDLRDNNSVFSGLAANAHFPVSVAFRGNTERAGAEIVSGNFFDTLEVQPALGRLLLPSDTAAEGSNPVVVLGYGYWKKRFGADPSVLNQSLLVNDHPMTIVGVLRPGFDGIDLGRIPDLYIPVTMKPVITPNWSGLSNHNDYWITLIGRLKPGISQKQATAALAPAYHALLQAALPLNSGLSVAEKNQFVAKPLVLRAGARGRPNLENGTHDQLLALMGMVALVLFITCANVAGLLTARGAVRQKEISIRLSVGAGRWRIIRQLVVESCLLSAAGALLGLLLATWMSTALVHFASETELADGLSDSLNLPVLLFAAGLALVCGVLFGIAPALNATRVQLSATLKEQAGALSSSLSQSRLRKILVVSQISLTLLLVTGAWGFVHSLYNLKHVDLGLRPDHVLQFSVAPQLNGYDQSRSLAFFSSLEDRIATLPGVVSLSGVEESLLGDNDRGSNVTVEGMPLDFPEARDVLWNGIGPSHFANLRIPLLAGREFSRRDGPTDPKVIIINETMAKTFFPDGQALGKHMKFGGASSPLNMQIVGIVRDSHHSDVREAHRSFAYIPYAQDQNIRSLTYYIRTASDPAALATAVRSTVGELDSSLPIFDVRTFDEQIDQQLASDKLVAVLAAAFGALAALLACLGIYGLLAFTVTQRTREIGVRMALGAEPKRVGWMLLSESARLLAIGILLGLPLAYALGRLLHSLLFGVQAFGFVSVSIACAALALVAVVATYAPSRRAMKIDPMTALRYE
jgi:putative ABC transport system permease protein